MQLNFSLFTLAANSVAAIASAAPATFQKRAEFCGQYDTTTAGDYTIYNNLWGKDAASSGSQCTEVLSSSGNTISWQTSWSWSGASSNVKSYANAALNFTAKKISSLSSVPFTWNWSYTGSDIDADVAFDIWVSPTTSTSGETEIMIWLAALGGAGPLGSSVGTFASGGVTWTLYSGNNGANDVYSFVASSEVTNLSADILPFLKHLVDAGYISDSLYLIAVQAGTEPFTGSNAVLKTSSYSVSVN